MLSGPVALNTSKVSFTFNVVYLTSIFQIISAKLLIWYIGDIPVHHKEFLNWMFLPCCCCI